MSKENTVLNRETNCCLNCAYFDKFPIQKKSDNTLGACKANPPVASQDYDDSKLGKWPLVLGTWWCGVFFNKNEEKVK